jgi:hypothetical protein
MPGQRLPMRKIRGVPRFHAAGMSKRKIAASLSIGATAAGEHRRRVPSASTAGRLELAGSDRGGAGAGSLPAPQLTTKDLHSRTCQLAVIPTNRSNDSEPYALRHAFIREPLFRKRFATDHRSNAPQVTELPYADIDFGRPTNFSVKIEHPGNKCERVCADIGRVVAICLARKTFPFLCQWRRKVFRQCMG